MQFRKLAVLAGACAVLAAAPAAAAYPERAVTVVVPYAAGGPTDVAARLIAQELSNRLKASFVADNRAGAGGNVGAEIVAKSKPDGYTLLVIGAAHAINKTLYKTMTYDIQRDFVPVALMTTAPLILLTAPTMDVATVKDLVAAARAKPDSLNYSSQGNGTAPHLAMELLKTKTGAKLVHVPYRGSAPALNDMMAGQVQVGFDSLVVGQPLVAGGKLKGLAITGNARSAQLPNVPTMAEAGFAEIDASVWYGMVAPTGTPQPLVDQLSREVLEILKLPEVKSRIAGLGAETAALDSRGFERFLDAEVKKWAEAVKASGAQVD